MHKRIASLVLISLIVLTVAPALPARAVNGQSHVHQVVPPEHTILVGVGQLEVSQGATLGYTPKYLDVTVGDTVTWRSIDELEPHTVSFGPMTLLKDLARKDQFVPIPQQSGPPLLALNPKVALRTPSETYDGMGLANSGLLDKGKSWSLTFTQPGMYQYICLIHGAGMTGYVIVHPAQPQRSTLYHVMAGDGLRASSDQANTTTNDAFYPLRLTVHVGDTVQWIGGFHTITFGPAAMLKHLEKNLFIPMPQQSGPPLLTLNPKAAFPSGGTTYDGTGFVNSGILVFTVPKGSTAPPSFKLTFTKAGTYAYACMVHPGMDATVVVLP